MTKELEDEIEEIKGQLEEAEKTEEVEEKEEEVVEEPKDEPKEEVEAEEKPEVKEEVKEEDNVGGARLRRENAALKKRLEEAESRPVEKTAEVEAEPDPLLNRVRERELVNQATQEFTGYVDDFRQRAPVDFQGVADAYEATLMQAIRVQNPKLTQQQLIEKTQRTILEKAGQYVKGGFNPAEEMYHEAKSLGIRAQEKATEKEVEEKPKPDLSKIAANKARNAGTAGAKGAGEKGQITPVVAAEMSAQEWARLPMSQRKQIMDDLKARGRAEAG
jgi:hypothetical protein